MEYFRGHCSTNNIGKEYEGEIWPSCFVIPPSVGDLVRSKNGKTLKIVSIIHGMTKEHNESYYVPSLEIILWYVSETRAFIG